MESSVRSKRNLQYGIYAIIIGIILAIFSHMRNSAIKEIKWQFKGVVTKVWYADIKHIPIIVVNGKKYNTTYLLWHHDVSIKVGDTAIKDSGDIRLKIIRNNSRDTIYFNH